MMQASLVAPMTTKETSKKQIFAVAAVIALGLCAVAFVVSEPAPQEDSISNVFSGYHKQAALRAHKSELLLDPGTEADDVKAIQAAWVTFKDSKDDVVLEKLAAFDPKAEEEKVATAISDMDALGLETKNEGDILKKLALPE